MKIDRFNIEHYTFYNNNNFNMCNIRRHFSKNGYSLYWYIF